MRAPLPLLVPAAVAAAILMVPMRSESVFSDVEAPQGPCPPDRCREPGVHWHFGSREGEAPRRRIPGHPVIEIPVIQAPIHAGRKPPRSCTPDPDRRSPFAPFFPPEAAGPHPRISRWLLFRRRPHWITS